MTQSYKEEMKKHKKNSRKWTNLYLKGYTEMLSQMPIENIRYLEYPLHSEITEENFREGVQFQVGAINFVFYSLASSGEVWQENKEITFQKFSEQMQKFIQSDPDHYDGIVKHQIKQGEEGWLVANALGSIQAKFKLILTDWLKENIEIKNIHLKANHEEETKIYFEFQNEPAILVRDLNEGRFSEANIYNMEGEEIYDKLCAKIEERDRLAPDKLNFPSFYLGTTNNTFVIFLLSDVLDLLVVEKFKKTKAYKLAKAFQGLIPALENVQ